MNTNIIAREFLLEMSGIEVTFESSTTRIGDIGALGLRGMHAERI
jgi:hypothetical protein